ncbi:hypothetical protein ACJMK2_019689 [Sinanodonta woodiana]|uniref:Transporter n=1 Tax=Sinanodonta woodiana TaxID=1069815 RepID=A0ABD3TZH1_SINWO
MGDNIEKDDLINEAQVDLLRGTEKYHSEDESSRSPKQNWGVQFFKNQQQQHHHASSSYPNTSESENPNESLVQDVSSTAVLTPLDDDLVGHDEPDRGNWSGRFDFLMSLLGYSVGLGNVWRFPYLAYKNGGGAFVFPFVLMLFLLGIPLMFLELSFGQFAAMGPSVIFERFCPLFSGLGYGMIFISAAVSLYYTVLIGWCILYLILSFRAELLWERCHPEWASKTCYSYKDADECHTVNGSVYAFGQCHNATWADDHNITRYTDDSGINSKHAPAQDFFENGVLHMSDGMENMGEIQWQIALCLLAAWTLTFFALSKGVKSTGKVVYFTALFPYVVLFILFFRGVTLPGASAGIMYYITPRFEKLGQAQVWSDAAAQIFFALSPAWGGLITLASYNKFHNNCLKDTLIVAFGNILTSLFAGFVIFAIIGYLASELNMKVEDVVDEGAGLAFIVYPDVVTRLPISPLWSILFFVMMITLGMGSEFGLLEAVITAVQDTFPHLREKKTWVVLVVSIVGFLGGLAFTCRGGIYLLQLMDNYVSSWSVFVMAGLESVMFGWIYGADRYLQDVEQMIGPMSRWTKTAFSFFWKFLSPFTLLAVLVFNLIQYRPLTYESYVYPGWANAIGWILSLFPIVFISSISFMRIAKAPKEMSLIERVKYLLKPTPEWRPAHKIPKEDVTELEGGKEERTISNPNFTTV